MIMVKVIAALLVLALAGAVAAPLTCVGWESSAADRRQCCLRAHHQHCDDQASADRCCAGHEPHRQAIEASPVPSVLANVDSVALAVPAIDFVDLVQASHRHYSAVVA